MCWFKWLWIIGLSSITYRSTKVRSGQELILVFASVLEVEWSVMKRAVYLTLANWTGGLILLVGAKPMRKQDMFLGITCDCCHIYCFSLALIPRRYRDRWTSGNETYWKRNQSLHNQPGSSDLFQTTSILGFLYCCHVALESLEKWEVSWRDLFQSVMGQEWMCQVQAWASRDLLCFPLLSLVLLTLGMRATSRIACGGW